MFELHSLDASKFWINRFVKQIPKEFTKTIHIQYSSVKISEFNKRRLDYCKLNKNMQVSYK